MVFNQGNTSPEKCLETKYESAFSVITAILWYYWHLLPGEQDAKCPAMHLHTKKSLTEKQWTLAHYKSNLRWRISCNT